MATSQAAFVAEKAVGHDTNATTEQDITNPAIDRAKYADPSGETMKALVWMGKNDVKVSKLNHTEPKISNRVKGTLLMLEQSTHPSQGLLSLEMSFCKSLAAPCAEVTCIYSMVRSLGPSEPRMPNILV